MVLNNHLKQVKLSVVHHSITVKRPYGGGKILRFSTEIAVYLANGTR